MVNITKGRILAVDDEEDILELLRHTLEVAGFEVDTAATGEEALEKVMARPPDIVLLDLMLPGIDGLSVCRRLRSNPATQTLPVIMITALGEEEDVIEGLEIGADDYLAKPFSPKVLVARVHAVMRRGGAEEHPAIMSIDELTLDNERHEVKLDGKELDLTKSEFFILNSLMVRRGKVMTRNQIISEIRGGEMTATERSIDVHVTSLRKKLGALGKHIMTVRGIGYRFNA